MPGEKWNYKGGLNFSFSPTNQSVLIKKLLKQVVSEKIKKHARGKKLEDYDPERVAEKHRFALFLVRRCRAVSLKNQFDLLFEQSPDDAALLYLVFKNVEEFILFKGYFNVESELALVIIEEALGNRFDK